VGAIDLQENILKAVDIIASRRIEQLKLDKTITAIIKSSVGVVNKKNVYKVEYDGGYFNAIAQNVNDAYLPKMAVYVSVPEGDFSKEKFIIGRASSIATGAHKSVVTATANNYGIIGKNNFSETEEIFSVRSYHDPIEEKDDETKKHRYNFLYNYGAEDNKLNIEIGNLLLYKNDATAIMFRADFMTKLSQEQKYKANGEYGLVLNLVFNNLAAGLGETQEEVFNYFAPTIKAGDKNLKALDSQIQDALKNENTDLELLGQDKWLDQQLNIIQELIRVFKTDNLTLFTTEMENTVNGYMQCLQDMINQENLKDAKTIYKDWMQTE